jgi:hypothetical protein
MLNVSTSTNSELTSMLVALGYCGAYPNNNTLSHNITEVLKTRFKGDMGSLRQLIIKDIDFQRPYHDDEYSAQSVHLSLREAV